jgi:hypothetical protein
MSASSATVPLVILKGEPLITVTVTLPSVFVKVVAIESLMSFPQLKANIIIDKINRILVFMTSSLVVLHSIGRKGFESEVNNSLT